jgi:hypothetical protein
LFFLYTTNNFLKGIIRFYLYAREGRTIINNSKTVTVSKMVKKEETTKIYEKKRKGGKIYAIFDFVA